MLAFGMLGLVRPPSSYRSLMVVLVAFGMVAAACTSSNGASTTTSTSASGVAAGPGVDLILHGGPIVTMDGAVAEAIAVDGNRIAGLGDQESVMLLAGADTSVVDLAGRAVFPGFIDGHSHWYHPDRLGPYSPESVNHVLLSRGWTGYTEANLSPEVVDLFVDYFQEGRVALRTNAYLSINSPGADDVRYGDWFAEYGFGPGSTVGDRLRIAGVKIFVAADWDRYSKWTDAELAELVTRYHQEGWQIAAKQLSDESLDQIIGAVAAARSSDPRPDPRHRLEHGGEMRPDQIGSVSELGLIPIVQLGGLEADFQGEEGFMEQTSDDGVGVFWPWQDVLAADIPIVGSIAVAPAQGLRSPATISVMQMVHGAVTGISEVANEPWPGRPEQLLTIEQALQTLTVDGAFATFEESDRGTLAEGKLADLVVLSANPLDMTADPDQLLDISVAATMIDGDLLWCGFGLDTWCAEFGQAAPERLLEEATLSPLVEASPEVTTIADLVITGGPILTMDPDLGTVEAVAVAAGTIIGVGSPDDIARYVGEQTTSVDLGGRALLPGFVDPHTHLLSDYGERTIFGEEQIALASGITTLADASVEPDVLDRLVAASDDLKVRVGMYLTRTDNCGEDMGTWYEEHPAGAKFGDGVFVAGVKIFNDGGTCGLVAASEPWIVGVDIGPPFHSLDRLTQMVSDAHNAGYQAVIHAQGDLAIGDAQSAIAEVLDGGPNELRHRIDHNSLITPELLTRYGDIGIAPVVFGSFPTCADIAWTDFWRSNGEHWRRLFDANPGLPIAWHGDDPSVPPVEPLLDLASYVTRAAIADDGSLCLPAPWLAETAITVDEGLAMMTSNAAYAIGRDADLGSITPGKLADFVVVSADPTQADPLELFDLEVLATYLDGVAEYCRAGNSDLCATTTATGGSDFAVSASASRSDHGPGLAVDGLIDGESFWSSGGDAPQWLQIDLAEPRMLSSGRQKPTHQPGPFSSQFRSLELTSQPFGCL